MCFVIEDVREQIRLSCKERERLPDETKKKKNSNAWVANWDGGALSPTAIKGRARKMSGEASAEQKEFAAGVLEYLSVLERVRASQMAVKRPTKPPLGFPYHGPQFHPPTHIDLWLHGQDFETQPNVARLEPLLVVHPLFFPELNLDKCPVSGCTGRVKKAGPTSIRTLYGVTGNVKVIGEQYVCSVHKGFSATAPEFWKGRQPWEMGSFPLFFKEAGMTRELFDLIAEMRVKCTVMAIAEGLKRALAPFPSLDAGSLKVPSEWLIRSAYKIFGAQRIMENERYMRTLGGLTLGVDSTMKIANKATVFGARHGNTTRSDNPWGGGCVSGVNEDREMCTLELVPTNSATLLQAPHCRIRRACCDYRSSITNELFGLNVVQDLWHLKERMVRVVPENTGWRVAVSKEVTEALVERPGGNGIPTTYRSVEEQIRRMEEFKERMMGTNVPSSVSTPLIPAIDNQLNHIRAGCLQRRHPHLPSNTSINESWHKRLTNTVRGVASSLPTVLYLVNDAVLRSNLNITIANLSQPADSPSRKFRAATGGSHHIFLLDDILRLRQALYGVEQPRLLDICPSHVFGVVPARNPNDQALRHLRQSIESFDKINRELEEVDGQMANDDEAGLQEMDDDDDDDVDDGDDDVDGEIGANVDYGDRISSAVFLSTTINGEADQDIFSRDQPVDGRTPRSRKRSRPYADGPDGDEDEEVWRDGSSSATGEHSAAAAPVATDINTVVVASSSTTLRTLNSATTTTQPRLSRSEAMYAAWTGLPVKQKRNDSTEYFRICALRLMFRWDSKDGNPRSWEETALHYNDTELEINPHFYNSRYPQPAGDGPLDGSYLRAKCKSIEHSLRRYMAQAIASGAHDLP
ncbi:hypothetical protein IAT38_008269 [Cryptococcus sp. DSM 104549]